MGEVVKKESGDTEKSEEVTNKDPERNELARQSFDHFKAPRIY